MQAALGQPVPRGLLTAGEAELIGGDLFRDAYRAQIGPSLVRLDAFVSDLARSTGTGAPQPPRPAWYTCLALEPGARSARAELLTALTVQWLTVAVTQSTATTPAVIIAGADEITRGHLEALADACERRGVPLTLLFRHLRDDATALIGGATATAFMRLGNHHEAEQAASFIGRQHTFTVSGWTATQGGEHSTASTSGYSHGTSQSRGTSTTSGWSGDGLWDQTASGGRTRSRDHGRSQEWSQSDTASDGRELEHRAEHPAGLRVRRRARRPAAAARQRPAVPGARHRRRPAGRRVRPADHHPARRRRQPGHSQRPRHHPPGRTGRLARADRPPSSARQPALARFPRRQRARMAAAAARPALAPAPRLTRLLRVRRARSSRIRLPVACGAHGGLRARPAKPGLRRKSSDRV